MQNNESNETNIGKPEEKGFSRRDLMRGLSTGQRAALAGAAGLALASRATAGGTGQAGFTPDFFVNVFLRGGADGLTLLAPYKDADYRGGLRTETRLFDPALDGMPTERNAIDLPGGLSGTALGLPPALAELLPIYTSGELAFIHAVGIVGDAQSHFSAQDIMESGVGDGDPLPASGWLGRHLNSKVNHLANTDTQFRAMSYAASNAVSLRGTRFATPVTDPLTYDFPNRIGDPSRQTTLRSLYSSAIPPLEQAFDAVDVAVGELQTVNFNPSGSTYPQTLFAQRMKHAAQLSKQTDVEVVNIDIDAWDVHSSQGVYEGNPAGTNMFDLMKELAGGLKAFNDDMKTTGRSFLVLVSTEFGRSAQENANNGTDHGKAGVAMAMGTRVNGGQVYGTWPGLQQSDLDDGDLAVTTDIRRVFSEITERAFYNNNFGVLPNYNPLPLGFLSIV